MSQYENKGQNPVKVQFKKAGKTYNVNLGEAGNHFDSEDQTSYPFDEITVAVGETVNLGDAQVLDVIEITPFSKATEESFAQYGEQLKANDVAESTEPAKPFSEATQKTLDGVMNSNLA